MSYIERTAKKLLPILSEVKKRMIPDKKKKGSKLAEGKDGAKGKGNKDKKGKHHTAATNNPSITTYATIAKDFGISPNQARKIIKDFAITEESIREALED